MAAVSAKTNYCSGFEVTGGGATSASAITVTLSDGTVTLNYMINIPVGVAVPMAPLVVFEGSRWSEQRAWARRPTGMSSCSRRHSPMAQTTMALAE